MTRLSDGELSYHRLLIPEEVHRKHRKEIYDWCKDTYGPSTAFPVERWAIFGYKAYFVNEEDKTAFILRWL